MELPIAFSPLRRWKIWALCSFGLSSSRVRSVTVWVSYHLKVLWGDWLAFWTCIPFGNTEISVLPYVSWQQRSNLTAIQGFLSVPGLDGFYDGITLFFSVFPCCDILCPIFTACPLESHCLPAQWCSACSVCVETGCILGLVVFYLTTLFLLCCLARPLFVHVCPSLVHFYAAWRTFWALLTPTWWDGLLAIQPPLHSEDGVFQVSLEQRLVTVAQRLSLLPVTSLLKHTKLMGISGKNTCSSSLYNKLYWNPIVWIT